MTPLIESQSHNLYAEAALPYEKYITSEVFDRFIYNLLYIFKAKVKSLDEIEW